MSYNAVGYKHWFDMGNRNETDCQCRPCWPIRMISGKDNIAVPQERIESVSKGKGQVVNRPELSLNNAVEGRIIVKPNNSNLYYITTIGYCVFLVTIGLIIGVASQSWFTMPVIAKLINRMAAVMPGLVRLANLSDEPQAAIFGYCLAFITMPFHTVTLSIIFTSRLNNGFFAEKFVFNQLKWSWLFLAATYLYFFTCILCDQDAGWRDSLLVSSKFLIATLAQFWVAAISAYLALVVVAMIIVWRRVTGSDS